MTLCDCSIIYYSYMHLTMMLLHHPLHSPYASIQPEASIRVIIRHSLPQQRLESINGSKMNAGCTKLFMYSYNICSGTSVLNDSIIPVLDGVNTSDTWASQLFTLNGTRGIIRLSFEVDSTNHDRMVLAVFNCPEKRIGLSSVRVYFDESFRPGRDNSSLGMFIMESQLMATSCDRLVEFCVKYNTTQSPTRFITLEIPTNSSANHVFLGEVTFLNGGNEPCYLSSTLPGKYTGSQCSCIFCNNNNNFLTLNSHL